MRGPRLAQQTDAGVAVALDPTFDQDEQVGPDGLRAGIAAPDPAKRGGEQEQAQPRHDQQPGHEIEFVGPDLDPEQEKAAARQIDQHGLIGHVGAAVPPQPGRDVIDGEAQDQDGPLHVAGDAVHGARIHAHAVGVELDFRGRNLVAMLRFRRLADLAHGRTR